MSVPRVFGQILAQVQVATYHKGHETDRVGHSVDRVTGRLAQRDMLLDAHVVASDNAVESVEECAKLRPNTRSCTDERELRGNIPEKR